MNSYRKKSVIATIAISLCVTIAFIMIVILGQSSSEPVSVIFIPKKIGTNDFWKSVITGAEMAAKENDISLEVTGPQEETDIEIQNEMILAAVAKHPNVIVVSPSSTNENLPALRKVIEQGIKLVFIDSTVDEEVEDVIVATNNFTAGQKMAEPMLPLLTKDSKIAIVSHARDSSTAIEREKGFRDGLGDYANQIVKIVYSHAEYATGKRVTKEMLEENPDIDFIACLNEDSSVGAGMAVKELNMQDQICMVGFDNSTKEIQMLEEGIFRAIVVQKAFSMGYLGIEAAVKDARGETQNHQVDSGSVLITRENMYDVENQELLFPFY